MSPGNPLTTNQHWFRYWLRAVLVTSQCLNKCWHSSLGLNEFSFIPLYHDTLCRCMYFTQCFYERNSCFWFYMYATLIFFPFKHLLLCIYYITFTCVYYLCIYYITLPVCYISLCINRFIYWKSGTSDHFGANVTGFTMYRLYINFLTLTLTLTISRTYKMVNIHQYFYKKYVYLPPRN